MEIKQSVRYNTNDDDEKPIKRLIKVDCDLIPYDNLD